MRYLTVTRKTPLITAVVYDGSEQSIKDISMLVKSMASKEHRMRVARSDFGSTIFVIDDAIKYYISLDVGDVLLEGEWGCDRIMVMSQKEFERTYDIVEDHRDDND